MIEFCFNISLIHIKRQYSKLTSEQEMVIKVEESDTCIYDT